MLYKSAVTLVFSITLLSCSSEQSPQKNQQTLTIVDASFEKAVIKNIIPLPVQHNNIDEQALAQFADKIANVRILGLGEQTHGAGSVFSLKVDLIKYLHQEYNFDLFILESGLYDVEKVYQQAKQGKRIKDLASGNIFYMYANSDEVTPLFDYINEQATTEKPLILAGFDSQHTGGFSNKGLVTDLTAALKLIDEKLVLTPQWLELEHNIQQVLKGSPERLTQKKETVFFDQLAILAESFNENNEIFWYRITKGLIAQANKQWKIEDYRSKEMGENIKFWAEQYPDKKIIVWAHTWHLTKQGEHQVNAGQVVSDHFKDQYYMAHFTGEQGGYLSYVDMSIQPVEALSVNAIELITKKQSSSTINFIDMKDLSLSNTNSQVFANDYQRTINSNEWNKYWDGLFILKNITPASYNP